MFGVFDNHVSHPISELYGWAGAGAGGYDASGFVFALTNGPDANNATRPIMGVSMEQDWYAFGVYSGGLGKVVLSAKYDNASNWMTTSILTQAGGCIPSLVTGSCNATTTFSGTPPHFSPYNTCPTTFTGCKIRLFEGTDNFSYPGVFQAAMILNHATTVAEETAIQASLAQPHFATKSSGCAATTGTLTGSAPFTAANAPASYVGTPALNAPNLVSAVGARLVNPDYNGPILAVSRADNGVRYDIYAQGCDIDGPLALAGSGTTLNVEKVYGQEGASRDYIPPSSALRPTVNLTGINSHACISFTAGSPLTAIVTASFPGDGTMIVSAVTQGTIITGGALYFTGAAGFANLLLVTGQVSGAAGGIGTYTVNAALTKTSTTVSQTTAPALWSDPLYDFEAASSTTAGLYQNVTNVAVFKGTAGSWNGPLVALDTAYTLFTSSSGKVVVASPSGTELISAATYTVGTPHITVYTADNSGTQNLTLKTDNGTADTATTTHINMGTNGITHLIGWQRYGSYSGNVCLAELLLFNDIESSGNQTLFYNHAHAFWGTP